MVSQSRMVRLLVALPSLRTCARAHAATVLLFRIARGRGRS